MSHLRRIASGSFLIGSCISIEELKAQAEQGNVKMHSIEEALVDFPSVEVDERTEKLVRNGVQLYPNQVNCMQISPFAIKNLQGECLAIYEKHPTTDMYRSVRGLF